MSRLPKSLVVLVLLAFTPPSVAAQTAGTSSRTPGTARISEEIRSLSTYPFSEPNPVPILTRGKPIPELTG